MDFKLRIYKRTNVTCLGDIRSITISNITLIVKDTKYQIPRIVESNKQKFGYKIHIAGSRFLKAGGSHNYPTITFGGSYIDIIVRNFPRYPCFAQEDYAGRNAMNGYHQTFVDNGFDIWPEFRRWELTLFTKIKKQKKQLLTIKN